MCAMCFFVGVRVGAQVPSERIISKQREHTTHAVLYGLAHYFGDEGSS